MTNHWIDIRNADVILVMGSNPASNHPISMKWVMKAKEGGAKLIVVDPRFTQTAAKADVYAPMRSGTDIPFLGGMIKYILDNNLIFRDYVVNYTNASFLINPDFKGPGELNGLFSGYDDKTRKYDKKTWSFQMDENGVPKKDPTLRDPHCVYQLLKKQYSRYTLDTVSSITGTPKEKLEEVYKLYASTGKPNRVGTELYAMGWTQHTIGTQNIRAMCIIQLLLGNMGIAGGGINALRGESNVQGGTDYGILFHILPGYLAVPSASITTLPAYIEKYTPKTKEPKSVNWWSNRPKYITSYLKAIYGDKAKKENDFGYAWLPKLDEGQNAPDLGGRAKERLEARLNTPAMKNVVMLARPFDDPLPADVRDFDLITFFFYYHDTSYMAVDRAEMNRKLYAALKPGGILVIADHSARPGDGTSVAKTIHRIEESVLRREVEAAGFKLIGEGDFLRHPEDTRDFSVNRPTGPVDEFVLKYQKPN